MGRCLCRYEADVVDIFFTGTGDISSFWSLSSWPKSLFSYRPTVAAFHGSSRSLGHHFVESFLCAKHRKPA
jgi:hypothetical protein